MINLLKTADSFPSETTISKMGTLPAERLQVQLKVQIEVMNSDSPPYLSPPP